MTPPSAPNAAAVNVVLNCHPATPCAAVRCITVQLRRYEDTIDLQYSIDADIAQLLVPDQTVSRRADDLWQRTCFEAFIIGTEPGKGYHEFNFSPSTEWAIYGFDSYRAGMTIVEVTKAPRISLQRWADRLRLDVVVDLDSLRVLRDSSELRVGLAAVIEQADHSLSYWSVQHPAGKPDFHHAEAFVLKLVRGSASSIR